MTSILVDYAVTPVFQMAVKCIVHSLVLLSNNISLCCML